MKIMNNCNICQKEHPVEILGDKLIFTTECPDGHRYNILIQDPLSAVLFDNACIALHKGYYRAAVLDFQASLEKLWEEHVDYQLYLKNISDKKTAKLYQQMKRRSHIKEGAFYMLQTLNGNDLNSRSLIEKRVKMRDKVFHKGHIPTKNEAFKFANHILKSIEKILNRGDFNEFHKIITHETNNKIQIDRGKEKPERVMGNGLSFITRMMASYQNIVSSHSNLQIDYIVSKVVEFWKI